MREQIVRVDCYSGFKADERPLRLNLRDGAREVVVVEDRWYFARGKLTFACWWTTATVTCFAMTKCRMSGAWPDIELRD